MEQLTANLKERFDALKGENLRIREAAKRLEVSEAELVALGCGENVTRLRPEFEKILAGIEQWGYVMALTRNDQVVHERKGTYLNGSFGPHARLFVGAASGLRIFLSAWGGGCAGAEFGNEKPRRSLQFFGKDGLAMRKICL